MDKNFLKFAVHFAARSLWRNKRRSILTIATVALSVMVVIVANRYARAVIQLWQDGAADYGTAHAQLHADGFLDKPDGLREELMIRDDSALFGELEEDPAVEAVSKRLEFEGIISAGGKTIYFLAVAMNAEEEIKVSPRLFGGENDRGKFVTSENMRGINIGSGLAEALELRVGDEAVLLAQTMTGAVNAIDAVVAGIIDLPVPAISKRAVYADISYVQRSLRMNGLLTEVGVRLKEPKKAEEWIQSKKEGIKSHGATLSGWWEITPVIRKLEMIFDSVLGLIAVLLFISAGISVLNIIFMLVAERTIEIGTLMAIGAKPKDIKLMFTLESSLIGVIGGFSGAVLGNLAVLVISAVGVPFDSPFSSGQVTAHPTVHLGVTAVILLAAIAICYVAAIRPSKKAAQLEPVVAFRGQMT